MVELTPMAKVAINMDDGSVAVMGFVTEGRSPTLPYGAVWLKDKPGYWYRAPTDANLFAEISKAFPAVNEAGLPKPQAVSYKVIADQDVPRDRAYRDAWIFDGRAFDHDMAKARQIHLDKIRRARTFLLGELDRDYTKATGQALAAEAAGDAKGKADLLAEAAAIEARRQALRDAPQTIDVDSASTVEELKALWPDDLPRV